MRPRHKVVLLARSEAKLREWRLRLDIQPNLRMLPASTVAEVIEHLRNDAEIRAVVVQAQPAVGNLTLDMLKRGGAVKVLLFDCSKAQARDSRADVFEVSGPNLAARVIKNIRLLVLRRKGPKKRVAPLEFPDSGLSLLDESATDAAALTAIKGGRDAAAHP